MSIGHNIRTIRINNNFTQEQFAEEMFCSTQTISKLERNLATPDVNIIQIISNKFKIPVNDIISDTREHNIYERTFSISKKMLSDGIVPSMDNIVKHMTFSKKLLVNTFENNHGLILFLIKEFDTQIQSTIVDCIFQERDIIKIFLEKCLPIVIQNEAFLKTIYTNAFTRGIVMNYLKEVYSKLLFQKFPNHNQLEINIKINILVELICSIFTYNAHLSYNEITDLFRNIIQKLN